MVIRNCLVFMAKSEKKASAFLLTKIRTATADTNTIFLTIVSSY